MKIIINLPKSATALAAMMLADEKEQVAIDADIKECEETPTEIDMAGCFPVTKSTLTYDEEKGVYLKTLYGSAQKDALTGEQLSFANIVIQRTYHETRDDNGYLAYQMHDTTRDGYFITKGKMIHITWEKTSDYSPTKYFDDNGQEITFNTGKTMIFVIQEKGKSFSTFKVNGVTYED